MLSRREIHTDVLRYQVVDGEPTLKLVSPRLQRLDRFLTLNDNLYAELVSFAVALKILGFSHLTRVELISFGIS